MNRKIITTITVLSIIAVLIPAVLTFGMIAPSGAHVLEADLSQEEIIDMSTLIVKGTIIASHVEKSKITAEDSQETAFTVWKIKPDHTYKGKESKAVSFKTVGGQLSPGVFTGSAVDFERGNKVTVMLVKDPDSIFGDNYHLVSILQGAYVIEDGTAKSVEDRHNKLEIDLDTKIKNHLN